MTTVVYWTQLQLHQLKSSENYYRAMERKRPKKYTPYVQIICQINNIDFKAQHSNNLFLVSWTRTFVEPHKHIAHTQSTKPKSKQNIAKKNRLHVLVFMFVCWESEH